MIEVVPSAGDRRSTQRHRAADLASAPFRKRSATLSYDRAEGAATPTSGRQPVFFELPMSLLDARGTLLVSTGFGRRIRLSRDLGRKEESAMRRKVRLGFAVLAVALPLVFAVSAQANAGTSETINTHLVVTSPISAAPPYVLTDEGTFTASGAFDGSGTFSLRWLFAAVPAPSTGVAQLWQTLTDARGYTLTLRCALFANDFSSYPDSVPVRGTCTVLSATGPYASLKGSGKATGIINDAAATFDTTVVLPTS